MPILLAIILAFALTARAQTYAPTCPLSYDDMVSWMLPAFHYHHMTGSALTIYVQSAPGKMYFIKSANGFPLDEKRFDGSYIYDSITEDGQDGGWSNPENVKQYVGMGAILSHRCVGRTLGKVDQAFNPAPMTFVRKKNCSIWSRNQIGYVYGNVWNVGPHDFGGLIGTVDTRVLKYHWGCDSTYQNCAAREELWLAKGYGWVEWKNYVNENGQMVLKQDNLANQYVPGNVAPDQPCGDAPVQ